MNFLRRYHSRLGPSSTCPGSEWYLNGQLREELTYHKNVVTGTLRTFYASGQGRRIQAFGRGAGAAICFDSLGQPLPRCPDYHTFARLRGKDTYSGRFLKLVQQRSVELLPAGYQSAVPRVVYYTFRIDPAGVVRGARVLSDVPPELARAVEQAIGQLPAFEPARYEGQPTDDVVENFVRFPAR